MPKMRIFWTDGRVRDENGIGPEVSGKIICGRPHPGVQMVKGLTMVDILLDQAPAPHLARSITACVEETMVAQ